MESYCSSSNDRSLTKILIDNSNTTSTKCLHNFVNKSEWIDGLDIWSSTQIIKKNDFYTKNFDFHEDLGLYLPRLSISTKIDLVCSKGTNKDYYFPERLRQLIKKEENITLSDQSSDNNQIKNNNQEQNSNKIHFPIRQIESNNFSRENKSKQNSASINREKFQYLLKEQLTNLLSRETTNISSKRTVIRIPSVQIKHQNYPTKTNSQIDPTSIMERYVRIQQLLISPSPIPPSINNNKLSDSRQSPFVLRGVSNLGLTVTPLDFSSTRHLQNSSSDKISQQEITNRPATQPVFLPSSINQNEEQQKILLKRNIQTGFVSSSAEFVLSNKNSTDEQPQTIKKFHRHHRSASRTSIERAKNLQLLPHIAGKRIQVASSNQRNS